MSVVFLLFLPRKGEVRYLDSHFHGFSESWSTIENKLLFHIHKPLLLHFHRELGLRGVEPTITHVSFATPIYTCLIS